jgi:tetratricopeptide (TPR) repeat protein
MLFVTLSSALLREGIEAAQKGQFHKASLYFEHSVFTDGSNVAAWEALGLCALALGNLDVTGNAWVAAKSLSGTTPALGWHRSLESGAIARALSTYNRAIEYIREMRFYEALTEIEQVLNELPEFVPGWRAKGLLLARVGRSAEARAAWLDAPCSDDAKLRSYLDNMESDLPVQSSPPRWPVRPRLFWVGSLLAALGTGMIAGLGIKQLRKEGTTQGPKVAAAPRQDQESPSPPSIREEEAAESLDSRAPISSSETSEAIPSPNAIMGILLDGAPSAVAQLLASAGKDQTQWSKTARTRAQEILNASGWQHYRAGMRALGQEELPQAVRELALAVRYGSGTFYHDDALYALVRANELRGDMVKARENARLLLNDHPHSQFVNSITHRFAAFDP